MKVLLETLGLLASHPLMGLVLIGLLILLGNEVLNDWFTLGKW